LVEVEMLGAVRFGANIPVSSIASARQFYEGVLGVQPVRVQDHEVIYRSGGTMFGIYETDAAGKASHTLGTFSGVEDLESVVSKLRRRGVVFEAYDLPGLRTVGGIASLGPDKVAWFRDPDGNLLSIDNADFDEPSDSASER
jgi:catechol 2,3-dioxygenase-like lactoylglutathione lyase family enzyme